MDPLPCLKGVTKVQGSNRGHVPGGWHHYCMLCCGQMLRACGFLVSPAVTSCAAAGPAAIAKVLHSRQSALEQFITSSVSTMTVAAAEAACTAGSTAAAADGEVQQSTGPFSSPEALDAHVERAWAHFRSLGSPQWHVAPMVDQAVRFDVDSTFCADESIDEIAAFLGVGEQVAALTAQAMGGSVLFQDALASRLNLMGLSRQRLDDFLKAHPAQITPGIPELVAKLQSQGKNVFLVSGGFRQVIHPVAESLNIPVGNVHANNLLFKDDGSYAGFDPEEFTSRSGGKAEAVRHIRKKYGYSRVAMVGDGATDLEARLPDAANIFIGYGGVVERPNIAAQADWYLYKIQPLIDALE